MTKNEGALDRALRVLVGVALLVWASVLNGPVWAWIGAVPLATGLLGFCPLYKLIGLSTCPLSKKD